MTKELFVETLDVLKQQHDLDSRYADVIGEMFNCHASVYDSKLTEQVIKILREETKAPVLNEDFLGDMTDIEYFIYEIDFGRNYKDGSCLNEDGKEIPMRSPEDLWILLQSYAEQRTEP